MYIIPKLLQLKHKIQFSKYKNTVLSTHDLLLIYNNEIKFKDPA